MCAPFNELLSSIKTKEKAKVGENIGSLLSLHFCLKDNILVYALNKAQTL